MEFFVPGRVAPQGSKRYVGGNKASGGRFIEASKYLPAWRSAVTESAKQAIAAHDWVTVDGPVEMTITFYIDRPASISEKKRPLPIVPPDIDKLCRAILDALTNAGVYGDDGQVVKLHASKVYACTTQAGAHITIHRYDTPDGKFDLEV